MGSERTSSSMIDVYPNTRSINELGQRHDLAARTVDLHQAMSLTAQRPRRAQLRCVSWDSLGDDEGV